MFNDKLNRKPNILVVGDLILDHYLWGDCYRISPEAPVPVVNVTKQTTTIGGSGNVVNNLITFGANVSIGCVTGFDDAGEELSQMLHELGVNTACFVRQEGRKTPKKTRIIASKQQMLRYDIESNSDISEESESNLLKLLLNKIESYDIVVLSDYKKGVLTEKITRSIIKECNDKNVKILGDPKGDDYSKYENAYLLTPNKKEASIAAGINIKDNESLKRAAKKLKEELALAVSIITLSEEGIAVYKDDLQIFPVQTKEVFDVTGAGDTVIAALGFALGNGLSIAESVKFANIAAGVVVGKIGAATATLEEISKNSK